MQRRRAADIRRRGRRARPARPARPAHRAPSARRAAPACSSSAAATAAPPRRSTCACCRTTRIDVVLVEPDAAFVSCPMSNLVLGGSTHAGRHHRCPTTASRARHGVTRGARHASRASTPRKRIAHARRRAPTIRYDKLVLSPGVELMWDSVAGPARGARRSGRMLQAWKAGAGDRGAAPPARGDARRRRVRDHDPRGAVPLPARARTSAPARSRATSRRAKPRSQGADPRRQPGRHVARAPLFKKAWAEQYPGIVEYRPQHKAVAVDAAAEHRQVRGAGRRARPTC